MHQTPRGGQEVPVTTRFIPLCLEQVNIVNCPFSYADGTSVGPRGTAALQILSTILHGVLRLTRHPLSYPIIHTSLIVVRLVTRNRFDSSDSQLRIRDLMCSSDFHDFNQWLNTAETTSAYCLAFPRTYRQLMATPTVPRPPSE
ncbi:predicted protein [Aspergillus nidulans FGSC A4]|uniref:Uncharacterized protein n=1 Tax=Emericella nidulans (strain FGSC A4 / ATCC 38163 / CBS 112.46 / NRRL 194 / M139) TaxID=227321 RepID=Q5AQP5_EMENI|nr:hypothetical protein [Aspergillus nidulans FGSC A4]EAA66452.1 predicted protein [Aspergillus nidulans FGSC A4]CBF87515.1 TPA: hypothetical protein ANIA_09385 [Aspergillus nidulans FGSC A4]|eukprot:XP_682654.1 predicted protein [Aspergillus nidulans FGSC A4]